MRSRTRCAALLTVAGVLAALVGPGAAVAAGPKHETLLLQRTTPGASFDLHATLGLDQGGGFAGAIGARVHDGKVQSASPWSQSSYGHTDDGVHAMGTHVTTCTLGQCGLAGSEFSADYRISLDGSAGDDENAIFVVLEGAAISYSFESDGWTLTKVPFGYRYVDGADANAVDAGDPQAGAQVFLDASAPGGSGGSLAQAVPPCRTAAQGLSRGVGQVTLDGGATTPSITCPTSGWGAIADHAAAATTWRAHGVAAGDRTLRDTALLVVDLPGLAMASSKITR
jgi:hypothetical protein